MMICTRYLGLPYLAKSSDILSRFVKLKTLLGLRVTIAQDLFNPIVTFEIFARSCHSEFELPI